MKYVLQKDEERNLIHLIYLGQYAINAARFPDTRITAYDDLVDCIYGQYVANEKNIPRGSVTERDIADLRDRVIDEVEDYINDFEKYMLREMIKNYIKEYD